MPFHNLIRGQGTVDELPPPCVTCDGSGLAVVYRSQGQDQYCPTCNGVGYPTIEPESPCEFPRGSEGKIRYLVARYAAGVPLFQTHDEPDCSHVGRGNFESAIESPAPLDDLDSDDEDDSPDGRHIAETRRVERERQRKKVARCGPSAEKDGLDCNGNCTGSAAAAAGGILTSEQDVCHECEALAICRDCSRCINHCWCGR